MADHRTIEELLQAQMEGYGEAIVILKTNADHFEIKTNLLQLVQANPYHGFERENPHTHINNFKKITSTLKFRDVPNDERFKEMLRACPHHGFTELAQIDTFFNGLNDKDQDSLNAAAGGNLLSKTTREALQIIENKSKVRYSRNKPNVSKMNTTSRDNVSKSNERIDKLADQISILVDIFSKKIVTPAPVKAVEESCVTFGGYHAYYNCLNTDSNQPSVCVMTGTYNQVAPQNRVSNFMAPPGFAPLQNGQNSNTIPNPKGEVKAITTRSGVAYEGPSILTPKKVVEQETEKTMDKEQTNFQGSTAHIQPPVTPILEPDVLKTLPMPNLPYPLRLNDQKLPKIPLNENCSAMLLKKLPEKLGDPGKFLIPCDFSRMDVCYALADLGTSINLMPLSIWKKISLPELTPTQMTLKFADRSITRLKGVAEDVFVKVGKFHFLIDFVVVDFDADPRVPLILGRSFLRIGRTLIDVYGEEITLRVNEEAITFNLNQTTRYSSTYDDLSENQIDIIDVAREEYAQEFLGFSSNFSGGNPTSNFEPILFDSSPSLTPFEGSDIILEEIREVVKAKSSIEEPPKLELKELPSHLECAYLEGADKLPVIISKDLKVDEKEALLKVLKSHKRAIAWKIIDIKGIDPWFGTHKILMEEDYKPAVQSQRRVNLKIHEVIKKEVIKLLDAGIMYLISDSPWVSPIHCVPKKDGITVVKNENNELIPTRMPFGLCNAPGTFQRCMMAIFHDMIEKTMKVFMDDFSVFGDSFSSCLSHLDTMLQRFRKSATLWSKRELSSAIKSPKIGLK
uniref:Reverse transcriptase domain-containing protein n=1 Tax=Tanacetum cinerariifolium TaxID=118510 RepID=A0A6L2NG21_TANCI|nr:reverse transcriptase domain-containing protein [Tanacetum cinerariifolium]